MRPKRRYDRDGKTPVSAVHQFRAKKGDLFSWGWPPVFGPIIAALMVTLAVALYED